MGLTKDDFVARFLARRKMEKPTIVYASDEVKPHTPKHGRTAALPVIRDDAKRYASLGRALADAGYDPGGTTKARQRIEKRQPWKDGHYYSFDEVTA